MSEINERAVGRAVRIKTPISQHPAFAIIVTVWAAALLGLSLLVIPAKIAQGLAATIGLGSLGPIGIAAIAAVLGAITGYGVARVAKSRQSQAFLSEVQKISRVEAEPENEPEPLFEQQAEPQPEPQAVPQADPQPERQTAQYTVAMPTQFVPWPDGIPQPEVEIIAAPEPKVEASPADEVPADEKPADQAPAEAQAEPASEPVSQPATPEPVTEQPAGNAAPHDKPNPRGKAVQQLRGEAVGDLNMMQLLERFAVALEDHREHAETLQAAQAHAPVSSLSQALDALDDPTGELEPGHLRTGVSVRTRAIETESALQEALVKLDRLSGAA